MTNDAGACNTIIEKNSTHGVQLRVQSSFFFCGASTTLLESLVPVIVKESSQGVEKSVSSDDTFDSPP